jgi:hypothetical protein
LLITLFTGLFWRYRALLPHLQRILEVGGGELKDDSILETRDHDFCVLVLEFLCPRPQSKK